VSGLGQIAAMVDCLFSNASCRQSTIVLVGRMATSAVVIFLAPADAPFVPRIGSRLS
jgi:hypothetical protein